MPEEICSQEETVILFFLQMLSELSKNEMRGIIRNSNTVRAVAEISSKPLRNWNLEEFSPKQRDS